MAAVLSKPTTAQPTAAVKAESSRTKSVGLGKYREIVYAVGLFLVLDLGVLLLNFTISFEIANDAVGINLAGRQRMLSQRMTKALLSMESAPARGETPEADRKELASAALLFEDTLRGFQQGGVVTGSDNAAATLQPATTVTGQQAVAQARVIWDRYRDLIAPIVSGNTNAAQLAAASNFARANNVRLLELMNGLTTALEHEATQRSNVLRMVQTVAIVLALLNFMFILFKFIRRLNASDVLIDAAAEDTRRILKSVNEGLLLIDQDGRIGNQMSASVPRLFGRPVRPGQVLLDLLAPLVNEKQIADAREYMQLLFAPHVRAGLMRDLNPLTEVELRFTGKLGGTQSRFLSFDFVRAGGERSDDALLVTVQDVTARVELARTLRDSKQQVGIELGVLAEVLSTDKMVLTQFVFRSRGTLLEINRLLESSKTLAKATEIGNLVDRVARHVHAIKGDAAALRLTPFVTLAAAFEDRLMEIRSADQMSAEALLAVPLPLDDMLQKLTQFERILVSQQPSPAHGAQAAHFSTASAAALVLQVALESAAREAARTMGKQVAVRVDLDALNGLQPRSVEQLHDLLMQLVRNAVTHGIELPAQRMAAGKLATGLVQAWVRVDQHQQHFEVAVRDDGNGIDPQAIRAHLIASGQLARSEAEAMSELQIVQHLLRPGVSTAKSLDAHAGRGIGLDLVASVAQQLGGQLRLLTRAGRFTEFSVRFAG